MKKFILLTALICGFLVSNSQSYTYIAQRYRWLAGLFEALGLPAGDSAQFKPGQRQQAGAVYYDSTGLDAGFYMWTGTAWVLQGTAGAADLPDGLIQPGYVTYSGTGLKFYITPSLARFNGVIYATDYDSVTLTTADPDDPRKDVIYVSVSGIGVKTGVPAGPAAEPQMEAGQIKLTVVDIQAGASVPTITTNVVYDENTGESTVSVGGAVPPTFDPDNTSNVYHLTKSLNITNINHLDEVIFTLPSTVDLTSFEGISLFIRLKAIMQVGANIYISFSNGSTVVSNEVKITINKNSLTYQGLTVPMSLFTLNQAFADKITIRWYQYNLAVHSGFYMDYVHFESGVQQPGGGSTPMTVGAIGSKLPSPNGAVIENNVFYQQPASQTYPGLLSAADKTKLDSLRSDYLMENVGDGEELATQINDSTVGIKSLKAGTGVTLDVTDTTITVNSTGSSSQTLQQTFNTEVGGSVLTKIDTINFNNNTMRWLKMNTLLMRGDSTISTLPLLIQMYQNTGNTAKFTRDGTATNTVANDIIIQRMTHTAGDAGLGAKLTLEAESSTANSPIEIGSFAARYVNPQHWSIGSSGESEIFMTGFRGVSTLDTFMNIQKDLVRINNNADTLATLADVRAGGGGGGGSGISEVVAGYGLQNVNDSTLDVDSLVIANRDWVMDRISDLDTANLITDSLGVSGQAVIVPRNDTLYHRLIVAGDDINIDTLATGEIEVSYIGGSGVTLSSDWFGDTLHIGSSYTYIKRADIYDEMIGSAVSTTLGTHFHGGFGSGAGAVAGLTTSQINGNGWATLGTGTTTTGQAALYSSTTGQTRTIIDTTKAYRFETNVQLEDLSDGTETFGFHVGSAITTTTTTGTNAIWFRYQHSVNSGNWTCYSSDASTTQSTNSGVAVAADTQYKLAYEYDNGSVLFYINGTLVATHSTNKPVHNGAAPMLIFCITKSAGSTARLAYIDYSKYRKL